MTIKCGIPSPERLDFLLGSQVAYLTSLMFDGVPRVLLDQHHTLLKGHLLVWWLRFRPSRIGVQSRRNYERFAYTNRLKNMLSAWTLRKRQNQGGGAARPWFFRWRVQCEGGIFSYCVQTSGSVGAERVNLSRQLSRMPRETSQYKSCYFLSPSALPCPMDWKWRAQKIAAS